MMTHSCSHCDPQQEIDCTSCKLAFLAEKGKAKNGGDKKTVVEDDGDYSISEQMTKEGNDHTILILFLVAIATFACVIFFTKLLVS